MSKGYKRHNNSNVGYGIIGIVCLAIIMMPIVGAYLFILGKNDKQREIGVVILIIYLVCWIVSKF